MCSEDLEDIDSKQYLRAYVGPQWCVGSSESSVSSNPRSAEQVIRTIHQLLRGKYTLFSDTPQNQLMRYSMSTMFQLLVSKPQYMKLTMISKEVTEDYVVWVEDVKVK